MDAASDEAVSRVAAAIGEPARARILCCLLDGRARTATELAVVAAVSASTASAHLARLQVAGLIRLQIQGRHRYYSLGGPDVAQVLEGLHVLAGTTRQGWVPRTPTGLRMARTCYDHVAGTLGVLLPDRIVALGWLTLEAGIYKLTPDGMQALDGLGLGVDALKARRRQLVCGCLDWSERRCHLGGALGAALLDCALARRWVRRDLQGRGLAVTGRGQRELLQAFGLRL
jgi:DNA-binding transcriptional ArsR family regulator